jgi:hypothetical protein
MQVTPSNYFPKFLLNPLSNEISRIDRAICLIASILIGVLTGGFVHLGFALSIWASRSVENHTRSQNEREHRVEQRAAPLLRSSTPPTNRLEEINPEPEAFAASTKREIAALPLDKDIQEQFAQLITDIIANSRTLLSECGTDPETRASILDSVKYELCQLNIIANELVDKTSHAVMELERTQWTTSITAFLHRAARGVYEEKMPEEFEAYLSQIENVNVTCSTWLKGSLLHHLAKLGSPIAFVSILNEYGIDFNKQDEWENTPLLWAVANANNEMAYEILQFQQNLNVIGHGNTALHLAIVKGYKNVSSDGKKLQVSNLQLVQRMVEAKADLTLKNTTGHTPLHLACLRRDPEMIAALLEGGADREALTNDGKSCEELLKVSYEEASREMRNVTPPYLLPREDFERDQARCLDLLMGV